LNRIIALVMAAIQKGRNRDVASEAPPIIFNATASCRHEFEKCLSITELMNDEWAENRLADFNLWAASVGGSAKNQASLDQRLTLKPHVRDVVANLLRMLATFIKQCRDHSKSPKTYCRRHNADNGR
jgi:hypothetical protein